MAQFITDKPIKTSTLTPAPIIGLLALELGILYMGTVGVLMISNNTARSLFVFLALLLYVGLLFVPLIILRKQNVSLFHPILFTNLLKTSQLIRALPVYASGMTFHAALPSHSADSLQTLVVINLLFLSLGQFVYYIGFALFSSRAKPLELPIKFDTDNTASSVRFILGVLFSVLVFMYFMQTNGGIAAYVQSWAFGRSRVLVGNFYFILLIGMAPVACLLWYSDRPSALRSPLFWTLTVTSLLIQYLSSGSRSAVVYPLIIALLLWIQQQSKFNVRHLLGIISLGMVIIYLLSTLLAFRQNLWVQNNNIDWLSLVGIGTTDSDNSAVSELVSRSTSYSGAYPILAKVPQDVAYLKGRSYLTIITTIIPRNLWPNKPSGVDGQVGRTFFNLSSGVPPSPIGEAYWNFGGLGIVGVFFLFGVFQSWLYRYYTAYSDNRTAMLFYIITLFYFSAPSSTTIVNWLFILTPALMLGYFTGCIKSDKV